jgi:hypothetical protein
VLFLRHIINILGRQGMWFHHVAHGLQTRPTNFRVAEWSGANFEMMIGCVVKKQKQSTLGPMIVQRVSQSRLAR